MYAAFVSELCDFILAAGVADSVRGNTEAEITELERQLSVGLPAAMRECLRQLGRDSGRLLDGDEFGATAFHDAREVAEEITGDADSPWRLPENAVPFLQHQGYEFLFVYSNAGDDPPVWFYIESDSEPQQWQLTFTVWLRESAIRAVEGKPWNDEFCREISLHRDNWKERKKILDAYDHEASGLRQALTKRVIQADVQRGRITGPTEFQQIWNQEFPTTDLYRRLVAEKKRIPWGWIDPRDA